MMARGRVRLAGAVLALLLLAPPAGMAADEGAPVRLDALPASPPDYPLPEDANVVFYIQRSSNPNTVVYQARFSGPGRLDPETPVDVFWRRFNTEGEKRDLTTMEQLFAFGVEVAPAPGRDDAYLARVRGHPERQALVEVDAAGRARAVLEMGGRPVALKFAWVELDGGGWLPEVLHVDLYGVDLETGAVWRERLRPEPARQD